jgi:tRNA (uracil-5-)-methyltransferase
MKYVCIYVHTFIYLYDCREAGKELPPLEHLMGSTHIYETVLGLKFRVSPEAFFQINTFAAEVLYKSVAELSCPTKNTTVIDICCGTGPIGLCLAEVFPSMLAQHNVNS